jgi:hypothetical protein
MPCWPMDFVIVSDPRPKPLLPQLNFSPKPEPKIDRDGPVFDVGPISKMADIDRRALAGMLPKRRDPAVDAAIEAYLAKHRNRTRVAPPVEGASSSQAAEMLSEFLVKNSKGKVVRPEQIDRAAIAKEVASFPWEAGVTKVPVGFVTTKYGAQALRDLKGQSRASAMAYRRYQAKGSSGYRSAEEIRKTVSSAGSNLSLLGGILALDNDLENVCAYPLCLKPLEKDRRSHARYCKGQDCAQRDRRRLASLKAHDANQPLKRKTFLHRGGTVKRCN